MRSPVLMEMFPLITQPGGGSAQPWGQPVSGVSLGGGAGGAIQGSGFAASGTRGAGAGGAGGAPGIRVRETTSPAASRRGRTIAKTGARNLGLLLHQAIQEAARSIPMVVIPDEKQDLQDILDPWRSRHSGLGIC